MKMKKTIKELKKLVDRIRKRPVLKYPIALFFLIIGFLGGFVPIFQGWIFGALGLYILFGDKFEKYLKKK